MSVIGIAGCTALIVIGFGIKYSVSPLASEQYGNMWIYDGVVNYKDDLTTTTKKQAQDDFKGQSQVKSTMGIYNKTITIDQQMVTVEIPSETKDFDQYIHMSDYQTGKTLNLKDDGVYINAKLAEILDLKVGDQLTLSLDNKDYKVMTNSPTYDKQLALNEYWKTIGGLSFLPGTNRAADRFARASFYINALPKTDDERIAVASVFSVVRNVSVPYGISTPESPEISTTQWRTVSESKSLRYFFESSLTPNTFWVDLRDLDFSEGAPVLKLSIANGEMYHGNTAKEFKIALPFKFMGVRG